MKDCPRCDEGIHPMDEVYATATPRHMECKSHGQCYVICIAGHLADGDIEPRFVSKRLGGTA